MSFSGICIGGPLDGEFVESSASVYHTAGFLDSLIFNRHPDIESDMHLHAYFFRMVAYKKDDTFGVWLHQDISNQDIFELLVKRYAEHCKTLREIGVLD